MEEHSDSSKSSSTSYYTSKEGPESARELEPMATSAERPMEEKGGGSGYRRAGEIPGELRSDCQVLLEEQLYFRAIVLLNSLLGAGAGAGAGATDGRASDRSAPIPPPNQLALLNTIAVHPLRTTRADEPEKLEVAALALGYLRNVLAMVGPVQAGFRGAFRFHDVPRRRGASDSDAGDLDEDGEDAERGLRPLLGKMSNEGSLWSQGKDFWSTVGWAFNCCTMLPMRWRYWKAWLEFMLDVLEADWAERERMDEEALKGDDGDDGAAPTTCRQESMMAMYMEPEQDRPKSVKSVVKALLADGGSASSAAFREVFEMEHRGPPRNPLSSLLKRKRDQQLDLENDKFGDWGNDEDCFSSGISEPPTPHKPKAKRGADLPLPFHQGMVESVPLRLRLFKLVSAAVFTLRPLSELNLLYDDFAGSVKLLPLDVFALLVTQRPNPLLVETHVTFMRDLFHNLLPSTYRSPRTVDPEGDMHGSLTMRMLEVCYACHPANSVGAEDNAKLSLVVESAVQLLWACGMLQCTEAFAAAVERGIEAREKKVKRKKGRGAGAGADKAAGDVLEGSAERIRVLLGVLGAKT